jgi:hypothetical protein
MNRQKIITQLVTCIRWVTDLLAELKRLLLPPAFRLSVSWNG